MKHFVRSAIAACIFSAVLSGGTAAAGDTPDIAHGKALVEANCARCHAIGPTGQSQHPEAPAFRNLSERYPIDALQEAFVEGVYTGHPDMPEFRATPEQIADIIAFIETLQP